MDQKEEKQDAQKEPLITIKRETKGGGRSRLKRTGQKSICKKIEKELSALPNLQRRVTQL